MTKNVNKTKAKWTSYDVLGPKKVSTIFSTDKIIITQIFFLKTVPLRKIGQKHQL